MAVSHPMPGLATVVAVALAALPSSVCIRGNESLVCLVLLPGLCLPWLVSVFAVPDFCVVGFLADVLDEHVCVYGVRAAMRHEKPRGKLCQPPRDAVQDCAPVIAVADSYSCHCELVTFVLEALQEGPDILPLHATHIEE
jgi:hypothetical protein